MGDLIDTSGWFDVGASSPPPDAQPVFNSPVTTDSYSVLSSVSSGVESASKTLQQLFTSGASALTSLTNAKAQTNASSQAAQLSAQQQSGTRQVVLAQSTAAQQAAQTNANIATALAKFTASPVVVGLLSAMVLFVIAKKLHLF